MKTDDPGARILTLAVVAPSFLQQSAEVIRFAVFFFSFYSYCGAP